MQTIATNIRFPKDEYQDLKLLAFSEGKSAAALIREALAWYKQSRFGVRARISTLEKFRKLSVRIDVPVSDLVRQGRKFA